MNASFSVTIGARDTKFGRMVYICQTQSKRFLDIAWHAHSRHKAKMSQRNFVEIVNQTQ